MNTVSAIVPRDGLNATYRMSNRKHCTPPGGVTGKLVQRVSHGSRGIAVRSAWCEHAHRNPAQEIVEEIQALPEDQCSERENPNWNDLFIALVI